MTSEEVNKILGLLNQNKLEELKYYIETKRIRNFSKLRQACFEEYLKFSPISKKTILFDDLLERKIIFSNGVNLYYLNYNYVVLNSPVLIRNNVCKRVGAEELKKVEHRVEQFVSVLTPSEFFTKHGNSVTV